MAMDIINQAKKNGLSGLMGKYEHISHELQEALEENKKALGKLKKVTENALFDGEEKIKDAAVDAHRAVKKNPWPYIGAASVCGLFVGFLMGKKQ